MVYLLPELVNTKSLLPTQASLVVHPLLILALNVDMVTPNLSVSCFLVYTLDSPSTR